MRGEISTFIMHRTLDNPLLGLGTCVTGRVQASRQGSAENGVKRENMQGYIYFSFPPSALSHSLYLTLSHLANIVYYTLNCK